MHKSSTLTGIALALLGQWAPSIGRADDSSSLYHQFTLIVEGSRLDNLSLGDDPEVEWLDIVNYEFELELEYSVSDRFHLFLDVSLIDETETVEPVGERETDSGLKVNQVGMTIEFGETVENLLTIGRVDFLSRSEWWIWWDEELDAISLESSYGPLIGQLAVSKAQAPETFNANYIDPRQEDIRRIFGSLGWHFGEDQSLNLYLLDQADGSDFYRVGDLEDPERVDETDADLLWSGVSYIAGFEFDTLGEIEAELHLAWVTGNETLYEFEDVDGQQVLDDIQQQRVSGNAQSYRLGWSPAVIDDWTFVIGGARGSGDDNPDDGRDESYQQTGLQGENETFGELYQPGISNMTVQVYGLVWGAYSGLEIALMAYDYEQIYAVDEVREASLELDPNGVDRDLGQEIDLVFTIEALDGLQARLVAAAFEAGAAYGSREGERSYYASIELEYLF